MRRCGFLGLFSSLILALVLTTTADGRFSGATHGFCTGHVVPEAVDGGPIALVQDGDRITIDAKKREITWDVDAAELGKRQAEWQKSGKNKLKVTRGGESAERTP